MQEPRSKEVSKTASPAMRILLIAAILLIIGCIGYFLFPRGSLTFYIFAHLGALGLLISIAASGGVIAQKKHRNFWVAFFPGSLLPVFIGILAVIIVGDSVSCGGSISLAAAILVLSLNLFSKSKIPVTG